MTRIEFYGNINKYKDNENKNKDSELMHYGTIGQKWGVRKWQNPDGTFNEAGKERYFGKGSKNSSEEDKVDSINNKTEKRNAKGELLAHPDDPYDELTVDRLNEIRKYYLNYEDKFGSQPGASKAKEETNNELFSKKNEKGRSETADKMEDAAKELRNKGDDKNAQKIEDTAKELRDATKMTPDRKNMTKEEKKELRDAANKCWKTVNKGAWVSWFLFGLPGYAINCGLNWGLVKDSAKRLGIDGKSKTWSASDWNNITDDIMDRFPRKYKKEIAKRDAARNQSQDKSK